MKICAILFDNDLQWLVSEQAFLDITVDHLLRNKERPILSSNYIDGKHSDSVWTVVWAQDDIDAHRIVVKVVIIAF